MSQEDNPYDRPFSGSVAKRALHRYDLSRDGALPLLTRWGAVPENTWILRAGCGNAGLAVALAERGAACWSVDLRPDRSVAYASRMAADHDVTEHLVADDMPGVQIRR